MNRIQRTSLLLDSITALILVFLSFGIYLRTLAPTVAFVFDDSLEFQLLASQMAIAHPTGYPLYSILLKLFTFLPFGDQAYRANLSSAVAAALTVGALYLGARSLLCHFMVPVTALGHLIARLPAVIAALVYAVGPTVWSQAVIAEVYSLQALLTAVVLWLTLEWGAQRQAANFNTDFEGSGSAAGHSQEQEPRRRFTVPLVLLSFFAGLMLTHHRMSVLLFPGIALYVLAIDRSFLRQPKTLVKLVLAFLLPLLVYAYLPIRGTETSSLDGKYVNTIQGFTDWVLGTSYTVFLSQNPFNQSRDGSYYVGLFLTEFSAVGILGIVAGIVALFMRAWREWMLLIVGVVANTAFVLSYRVADVDVFFIPSFVIAALFLASGLGALVWLVFRYFPSRIAAAAALGGILLLLFVPLVQLRAYLPFVDLSNKWDVYDYGRELATVPTEPNATLIGILGEMSLVRYIQQAEGLGTNIETIAADEENERLAAVKESIERGRTVYLTRPLKGVHNEYSLSSAGPLVRVLPRPNKKQAPSPSRVLDADWGNVKLIGYDLDAARLDDTEGWHSSNGRRLRVTLYWLVGRKVSENLLVSVKLLDSTGRRAAQVDRQPVLDAYPTTAWRSGEYIVDTYDVPILAGAPPGDYVLQVTLFNPETGQVVGQRDLEQITLLPDTRDIHRAQIGEESIVLKELAGLTLVGFTLESQEPVVKGASVPVTLVWRKNKTGAGNSLMLELADSFGKVVQSQPIELEEGDAVPGQYIRQGLSLIVPEETVPGFYSVRLSVVGDSILPWANDSLSLGRLEVAAP